MKLIFTLAIYLTIFFSAIGQETDEVLAYIPEPYMSDEIANPISMMKINDQIFRNNYIATPVEELNINPRWKPIALTSALLLFSGFCDGTSEVLKIKYESFHRVFPGADDQFWDYNISWKNKYKDGAPPEARFVGSKSALVWTTDGYHLMRMMRNVTMITAVTIPISINHRKSLKSYLLEGVIYYISYTAGFNLAYDGVFK